MSQEDDDADDLEVVRDTRALSALMVDDGIAYISGVETADWFTNRIQDLLERAFTLGVEDAKTEFEKDPMIDALKPYGTRGK